MKKYQPIKTEYFECACHDPGHLLVFHYDPDTGDLWVDVHLESYPWYQRIWVAIKYVFGYKSPWGCFSCWMMNTDEVLKMQNFLMEKLVFDKKETLQRQELVDKSPNTTESSSGDQK